MKNSEILIAARAKLATPEQWTKGSCARDANGDDIGFSNGTKSFVGATCFCTFGAMYEVMKGFPATSSAWRLLALTDPDPIRYNDAPERTHAEVLAVFDKAIAAAQAAEVLENLTVLLAAVKAQPEELFNLNAYKKVAPCGTLFCTLGLASTLPELSYIGLGFRQFGFRQFGSNAGSFMATLKGVDVDEPGVLQPFFGDDAFYRLFAGTDCGMYDSALGYEEDYDEDDNTVGSMTHKELAIARLERRIAELTKDQA